MATSQVVHSASSHRLALIFSPDLSRACFQIKCGKGDGINIRGLVYDLDRDCLHSVTKNGALASWDNRGERIGDDRVTGCEVALMHFYPYACN